MGKGSVERLKKHKGVNKSASRGTESNIQSRGQRGGKIGLAVRIFSCT